MSAMTIPRLGGRGHVALSQDRGLSSNGTESLIQASSSVAAVMFRSGRSSPLATGSGRLNV
jgi:hypothetical protein